MGLCGVWHDRTGFFEQKWPKMVKNSPEMRFFIYFERIYFIDRFC